MRSRLLRSVAERRRSAGLALVVVVVASLQITNNLLPYVGMRDDSCQTMFSGLSWQERSNNHLFMPQRMLTDLWVFYIDVEARVHPEPEGRSRELVHWLRRDDIQHNAEAVRVAVEQLCERGYDVRLSYRPVGGELTTNADACADPRLSSPHSWIPVRLYDSHYPWPWPPQGEPAG